MGCISTQLVIGKYTAITETGMTFENFKGDLLKMDEETLNYSFGAFITEVRKENGEEYRGNTLYEIIIAIQHYLRENER